MTDSGKESMRKEELKERKKKRSPGYRKKKGRETEEGIEKGSWHREEKEREETAMEKKKRGA